MTLVKNPKTGNWEADIRMPKGSGRIHVSLRTKKKGEAQERYAAVNKLVKEQNAEVIERLRARLVTVEALTSCYLENRPFSSLTLRGTWPTFEEAITEYLTWQAAQGDRAPATIAALDYTLEQAADFIGRDLRIDVIRDTDIEGWKVELAKTLKPTSIRDYLLRLSSFFNWHIAREKKNAERGGGQQSSPRRPFTSPVDYEIVPELAMGARKRFLSNEETQRLFAATPDQFKFAIAAGLHAGLRIDEAVHLRPPPQDIDLEIKGGGILYVHEKEGWRPKTRKPREIPMTPELVAFTKAHVEHYASENWMMPSATDPCEPMSRKTAGTHFTRIVKDAGLIPGRHHPMGVTFHTLRHTFASHLVMSGVDLFTVARLLGHASTAMAEKVYGHLSPDHKRLAIGRLAGAIQLQPEISE